MSCLNEKEHEFEYSFFNRCYECKRCKAQKQILEEPERFEEIAKSIVQYCQEVGRTYDLSEAMFPILSWVINLTYLWKKVYK